MSLPILNITAAPTPATLIRYFHQMQSKWTEHVAQSEQLDFGVAWSNPELNRVHIANRMMDVALTEGTSPQQAMEQVGQHFKSMGSTCFQWIMNPSAPAAHTVPMVEHLLAAGYRPFLADIMYLQRIPATLLAGGHAPLQIIPARASFKHVRKLHEDAESPYEEPQLVEAAMSHLDDPHYDSLIAIQDGQPVAHIGVLSMGEVGLIEQVHVMEPFRGRGIGTTMMSRAIEICARSLFKHILLGVLPTNTVAIRLYERFGFRKIGDFTQYYTAGSGPAGEA